MLINRLLLAVLVTLVNSSCAEPQSAPSGPASLQLVPPEYYSRSPRYRTYLIPSKRRDRPSTIIIEREVVVEPPAAKGAQVTRTRPSQDVQRKLNELKEELRETQEQLRKRFEELQ